VAGIAQALPRGAMIGTLEKSEARTCEDCSPAEGCTRALVLDC
jgi:hypothetical protein